MRITMALAVTALLMTGCGGGGDANPVVAAAPLAAAFATCQRTESAQLKKAFHEDAPPVSEEMSYSDGSLLITTADPGGELLAAAAFEAAQCVLDQTQAPASIAQAMRSSTAMSGRQNDTYAKVKVGWSYNGGDPASFEASFDPLSS